MEIRIAVPTTINGVTKQVDMMRLSGEWIEGELCMARGNVHKIGEYNASNPDCAAYSQIVRGLLLAGV